MTGSPIITHSINLDGSSGSAETSFGGLIFDGDSAYANPTITANVKQLAGTAKISKITGTLYWRDHLKDQGNGDDVFEKTSTYTFPVNNPQSEFALSFRLEMSTAVNMFRAYFRYLHLGGEIKSRVKRQHSTRILLHSGESAVVVQNTARAETPSDFGRY